MAMPLDLRSVSRLDLPYSNLVLTGFLGVGKSTVGRTIAQGLGVDLFDVDEEIELRELMSIARVRELFGDTHLRTLEHDFCRQAALMRRAVVVVSGAALLDERNFSLLTSTGQVVVLTCELGEALRRLHLANEQQFRDRTTRRRLLGRLRREYAVVKDARLLQMDTTHLTVEEEAELLVRLWINGQPEGKHFRYGPPPPITPPPKAPLGLSSRRRPDGQEQGGTPSRSAPA